MRGEGVPPATPRDGGSAPIAAHDVLDTAEAGQRIVRGGALRVIGYGAGSLLTVGSAAALTRELGPADFGRYVTVFSLVTIVMGLTDAGTANIGVRELSLRSREAGRAFLAELMTLRLAITLVGVLGAVVFALVSSYTSEQVTGTVAAGVGLLLAVVFGTLGLPLQASLRLGWAAALDFVRQALTVVGLVVLALAGAGIVPLLAVPIPVGLAVIAATLPLVRGQASLALRPMSDWRGLLKLTLPYAAATAVAIVYSNLTVVLLSLVGTSDQTGWFGAAFRVYIALAAGAVLVVNAAFPLFARTARTDSARLAYGVQRVFETCVVLGALGALTTAVAAPAIIDVIAGADFGPAVEVLRLQAIALGGMFVVALGGFVLLALERYRLLLVSNLVALVLSATLTLTLVPAMGANGAAVAMAVCDVTLGTLYVLAIRSGSDGVPLSFAVLPKAALALALGAAAGFATGLPAVPAAVLAAAVCGGVLLLSRAVPAEMLHLLPRRGG